MKTTMRRAQRQGDGGFHEMDPQAANQLFNCVIQNNRITTADRKLITTFANEIIASNNVGKSWHFRIVSLPGNWL